MSKSTNRIFCASLFLFTQITSAAPTPKGNFLFEAGAYCAMQGKNRDIYINSLIGDRFNATSRTDGNGLFGLGYLLNAYNDTRSSIGYGLNLFYLAPTRVAGTIDQEQVFTNLGYSYYTQHIPLYAMAKADIKTNMPPVSVTLDAGIGPDFMDTSHYINWSLDGITQPDNAFIGRTQTVFSAMAGIALKFTYPNQAPFECGYRFFYSSSSEFHKKTDQIINTLTTGSSYAQALVCTVTV